MHLASPIRTFFFAQAPQDDGALAAAFAPDALVRDEGRSYRGPQAIRGWWLAAKEKYRHHAEPFEAADMGGKTLVKAKVVGDFPGSPAILAFTFGLKGDRIVDLTIG